MRQDDLEGRIVEALRGVAIKPGEMLRPWVSSAVARGDITVGDFLPDCWLNEMTPALRAANQPDPWTEDFLKRCAQAVIEVVGEGVNMGPPG